MSSLKVEGIERIERRFAKAQRKRPRTKAMNRAVGHLHRRLAIYPPPPPGSSYRRTGRLGQGWKMQVDNSGRKGIVYNQVRDPRYGRAYAPYVQGRRQARIHKITGWKTTDDIAEKEADKVAGFFREEYMREWER